jgi:hypothetical protein
MIRRQSATDSIPHRIAAVQALFYDLLQLLNFLIQACCHSISLSSVELDPEYRGLDLKTLALP